MLYFFLFLVWTESLRNAQPQFVPSRDNVPFLPVNPEFSSTRNQVWPFAPTSNKLNLNVLHSVFEVTKLFNFTYYVLQCSRVAKSSHVSTTASSQLSSSTSCVTWSEDRVKVGAWRPRGVWVWLVTMTTRCTTVLQVMRITQALVRFLFMLKIYIPF